VKKREKSGEGGDITHLSLKGEGSKPPIPTQYKEGGLKGKKKQYFNPEKLGAQGEKTSEGAPLSKKTGSRGGRKRKNRGGGTPTLFVSPPGKRKLSKGGSKSNRGKPREFPSLLQEGGRKKRTCLGVGGSEERGSSFVGGKKRKKNRP